jgi:hypothetical protein
MGPQYVHARGIVEGAGQLQSMEAKSPACQTCQRSEDHRPGRPCTSSPGTPSESAHDSAIGLGQFESAHRAAEGYRL